ncbi:MAG: spheroidene monooxygenase [Chitinophagaceae bacterium]
MYCSLTLVKYPKFAGIGGFLSMAIFRLPLYFKSAISFWKLMGCGKNGTFDKVPDWRQWAVLTCSATVDGTSLPPFCNSWFRLWGCEISTILLQPIEGHGLWDAKQPFGKLAKSTEYEGPICVLTRATIRLSQLSAFWQNVAPVAQTMTAAPGFLGSVGIGEVPWIKQATFSIWQSKAGMKQFAYQRKEHATVVQKTRKEKWYSEEMFVRFIPLAATGYFHKILQFDEKL